MTDQLKTDAAHDGQLGICMMKACAELILTMPSLPREKGNQ
jgi:hypothetical protein